MIPLLFLVLLVEGAVSTLLMVNVGPLRELTMKGLDQLKTGKGPATMKTLACTLTLIFVSSIFSIGKIQNKGTKIGTTTPMDQVLWRTHVLEASLTGYSLFLGFIIDRLHHYLTKLSTTREALGVVKLETKKLKEDCGISKERREKASQETKNLGEEMSRLKQRIKKLKLDSEEKDKQLKTAEAHVLSLQKQSEELLLEYDRLLEDNQTLQSQSLTM